MHWLLAYTKPRQERVAEEPLFPRYLFVGAGEGTAQGAWAALP
jgi:hypothetical protein